jgi:anti-sigma factor RsiW
MKTDEIRELLPAYAAGALGAEKSKQVEALLATDPGLKKELAEWQVLRSTETEVRSEEPAFRPDLLGDMHRRIDAYEDGLKAARMEHQRLTTTSGRSLGVWIQRIASLWDATPFAAQVAVAAQFAALAVLISVMSLGSSENAGFTTASGGAAGAPAGQSISVVFQPSVTLGEMQTFLESTGAQIIAGPSGQGAYTLGLGDIENAEVERLLETLRDNTAVVRFATPME